MTMSASILRRGLLAAAVAACALSSGGLGAQVRLEVAPFVGYMPGFDMESEMVVSRNGQSAAGSLRRDVDGGRAFGLRAELGVTRHFAVYGQAATGETGQRHDNFWSMGSVMLPVAADYDGYDVQLLAAGISVQPVGPLLRIFGGPAVTRLREGDEDAVSHGGFQAGFAVGFQLMPRVHLSAGMEDFVIRWDEDAIAGGFTAEVAPTVSAESTSGQSHLPLIRLGVSLTP
jgi:hypothetical protein